MRGEEGEEDSFCDGKFGRFSGDILSHLSPSPEGGGRDEVRPHGGGERGSGHS